VKFLPATRIAAGFKAEGSFVAAVVVVVDGEDFDGAAGRADADADADARADADADGVAVIAMVGASDGTATAVGDGDSDFEHATAKSVKRLTSAGPCRLHAFMGQTSVRRTAASCSRR
jgi:hypothetical protein